MTKLCICNSAWKPWRKELTPHLNGKKLSTNSPWDFEYVLEIMDDYCVGPDENFSLIVLQPGGSALIFSKSGRNQNLTPLWV